MLFFGLLLFIFLIIIRPQDFLSGVKGMDLVFYLMTVLLPIWLISPVKKKLFRTPQDKFVALFFITIIVSTIAVHWITYSIDTTIETAKLVLIYYFVVTVVDTKEKFKVATGTLVVLLAVMGFICILQSYGIDLTGVGMEWSAVKHVWQIKGIGIFDNPNDIAYSIILAFPFALGLVFCSHSISGKIIGIVLMAVSGYCIFLTESRGGYLAAFFCMITWIYFWISNKTLKKAALLIGIVAIIAGFAIQTGGYRHDESSMGRIDSWVEGMKLLESHPIIGIGRGQWREYHHIDTHNSFVRAGAALGIFGLYAYIGIIYTSVFSLIRGKSLQEETEDWKLYRLGFLSYLGAYVIGSVFSTRTYDIVFLVVVALTGVLLRLSTCENDVEPSEINVATSVALPGGTGIWNRYVLYLMIIIIVIWKVFLMQVWR